MLQKAELPPTTKAKVVDLRRTAPNDVVAAQLGLLMELGEPSKEDIVACLEELLASTGA